jgi:hypothetical protein
MVVPRGRGDTYFLLILDLGSRGGRVVIIMARLHFTLRKEHPVPIA